MPDLANLNVYAAIFGVLKITYNQDARTDFDGKYVKKWFCAFLGVAKPKFKLFKLFL